MNKGRPKKFEWFDIAGDQRVFTLWRKDEMVAVALKDPNGRFELVRRGTTVGRRFRDKTEVDFALSKFLD